MNNKTEQRIHYYDNGVYKCITNYKNGKKHGKMIWFYENGNLDLVVNYKDGKKHGEEIFYNEDGVLIDYKNTYKDGVLIDNE